MRGSFADKKSARQAVWDALSEQRAARFPFPPHGRIPNFAGAKEAAERLLAQSLFRDIRHVKVNPDAPQRFVRERLLELGVVVYMPTPRLRGGFKRLDPARIPGDKFSEAATLSKADRWAETVDLKEIPSMDVIVAGSVAVTRDGRRCGKGEGYSDLEFAVLRELGHPAAPVVTTVHDLQIVQEFPRDRHDVPVSLIATPTEIWEVPEPPPPPDGIDWDLLSERDFNEMPILEKLKQLVQSHPALTKELPENH